MFNKIKAKLGGRVRVIISGGAPLPVQAEEFLRVSMCAPVVQVMRYCTVQTVSMCERGGRAGVAAVLQCVCVCAQAPSPL